MDADFTENFIEDFAEDNEIDERNLNPNRKIHIDKFVEKYNKILDSMSFESKLNVVNSNFDHSRIEEIESDVTCALMKDRKSAEGDAKRNDESSE